MLGVLGLEGLRLTGLLVFRGLVLPTTGWFLPRQMLLFT